MSRYHYRSSRRGRRALKPKPPPNNWFEYFKFTCHHCQEIIYARASDLHGVYGRTMECNLCKGIIRIFKRTHANPDKCITCEKVVICLSTPRIRVGTGTEIKKDTFKNDNIKDRIMNQKYDMC